MLMPSEKGMVMPLQKKGMAPSKKGLAPRHATLL
jgi:hypothetical protein